MKKSVSILTVSLALTMASSAELVFHWTFDSDGANTVGGIDMTLNSNAAISSVCSKDGEGALEITAAGAPVIGGAVTQSPIDWSSFANGDQRTVTFWALLSDSQEVNATMFGAGANANGERFDIRVNNGGSYRVEVQGGGFTTSENVTDSTWHHYAVVLPADGAQMMDFIYYLDGALLDTSGNADTRDIATATAILRIGDSANAGTTRDLDGFVDDVRIYDTALTLTEIQALNDAGRPVGCFGALEETVIVGSSTDLTWQSDGVTSLVITNDQDASTIDAFAIGESGSVAVSPTVETVYTITADGGADVRQVTIGVRASPDVDTFTDSPELIFGIGDVTLAWTTAQAGRITITDDQGSAAIIYTATADTQEFLDAGSVVIPGVAVTTVYTISATLAEDGTGEVTTLQTTSDVQAAPDLTLVAVPSVTDGAQEVTLYFNATVISEEAEVLTGTIDGFGGGVTLADSGTNFDENLLLGTSYFLRRDSGDNTGALTEVVSWSVNEITLVEDITTDISWLGGYTLMSVSLSGADTLVINDGTTDIATITDPVVIADGSLPLGVVSAATTYTATASISGAGSAQDSAAVDVAGVGSSYEEVILGDSPLGFYRFEESSGSAIVYDFSGNANHSVGIDNPEFFTSGGAGVIGNGGAYLELDELGSSVVTGVTLDPASSNWSITGLVRATELLNGNANIVSNRDGEGVGRSMFFLQGLDGSLASFTNGGVIPRADAAVDENSLLFVDAWCHVGITYNNTSGTVRLYLNGQLDAEDVGVFANSATGAWVIGAQKVNELTGFWNGILDEIAIFNSELTAGNITAQNNAFLANASGLLAFGQDVEIEAGQSAELIVKIGADATAASIDNSVGSVPIGASTAVAVSPLVTTTYTIDVDGVTQSVTVTVVPSSTITITDCGFDGSGRFFIDVAEGVTGFRVTTSPDLSTDFADAVGVSDDGANRFLIDSSALEDKDFFRVEAE